MNIIIKERRLKDAITLSHQIPEFENPYQNDEYKNRLAGIPHHIVTAYMDNKPVGFKIGYERKPDGSFYSWMGGVLPQFRRQGIADALAVKQEEWAKKRGYRRICMKTRKKHLAMLKFAQKRGFVICGTIPKEPPEEIRILLEKQL